MSVRLDQRAQRLGELRARRAILAMNGVRPRRRRRARRQQFPRGERLAFQRAILEILTEVEERFAGEILPSLERFAEQVRQTDPSTRLDAPIDEIRALIERLRGAVMSSQLTARIRALVGRMAERVSAFNRRELDQLFGATLGVGLPAAEPFLADALAAAVSENVRRVTGLVMEQFDQLENTISSGFRRGLRSTEIAGQIQERLRITRNRAKLIARDQVASLNGELTRQRQTNLGVREYIWRTSGDERVRPSHEDLDGRRFRWDDPPDEGHPGTPILCRCVAEPVLDELIEAT